MASRQELICYTAGLFDGEGCVRILKSKRNDRVNPRHGLYVYIVNTDRGVLEFCQRNFGGSVRINKNGSSDGYKRKVLWMWTLSDKMAINFLTLLLPYLVIKKEQVLLAISFRETFEKDYRGRGVPKDVQELREIMFGKMINLKKQVGSYGI